MAIWPHKNKEMVLYYSPLQSLLNYKKVRDYALPPSFDSYMELIKLLINQLPLTINISDSLYHKKVYQKTISLYKINVLF